MDDCRREWKPPNHLSSEMKKFWGNVLKDYELESDALLVLRTACEQWDRAQQAREVLANEGITIGGKKHKAIDVDKQAVGLFLRSMRQLGLDVVAPGSGLPLGRRI